MEIKKNIFSLREKHETKPEPEKDELPNSVSMNKWGWDKAKTHNGSIVGLKVCLQHIFQDYKKKFRDNKEEQEQEKIKYKVKLQERQGDVEIYNNRLKKINEVEIPQIKEKIDNHQNKISDIKKNPEDLTGERSSKIGLYIGATILIFITIYLFVFYSSATYSAFFKEIQQSDINITNSIFDAQALSKAFSSGFFQGILILTLPFLFLGLGYIVDEFKNRKDKYKVFKIGLIISVTFIFDAILAYSIEKKILDARRLASFTPEEFPVFDLSYAITSVDFWLIIFAGFVAYIIWGLVFSFFMEAYENSDKVHTAIKQEKQKIARLSEKIEAKEEEKSKLEYKIGENKREIEKLNVILNDSDIINYKELENRIVQFFDGWLEWMNANKREELNLKEAHEVVQIFISNNIVELK